MGSAASGLRVQLLKIHNRFVARYLVVVYGPRSLN